LGVDLLADGEPVRTLLAAIAGEFRPADDAGRIAWQGQLEAAVMHRGNGAGDDLPLADAADRSLERIVRELLHAEADTLLLDVDVENLDPDGGALLEVLDRLFARPLPVQIGQVNHAVDLRREADEQTELG